MQTKTVFYSNTNLSFIERGEANEIRLFQN